MTSLSSSHYLASILLPSDAYEAELNSQLLDSLASSPARAEITSLKILPGPPNRACFLESFFSKLLQLPFSVKITTPEQEYQEMIAGYEDGRPDPTDPDRIWRALSLEIRLELSGARDARLFLRESPCESLAMVSFAFDPSAINGCQRHIDNQPEPESDLPLFRELLGTLINAYPVISGTLGLDIAAIDAGLPHDEIILEDGTWLQQVIGKLRQTGREDNLDCIYINGSPWGFDRPFVYDRIEPSDGYRDTWAGRHYHDLHVVEKIRVAADQATQAYSRMYGSSYPKDDRDDALLYLSKAIALANDINLDNESARLKECYDHINEVYNSQFRRR
jgi:hypothetical protein